ncbi:MAG: phage adaptor protein [Alphaproteobacteria bacterium]|jgi:hypothetical protein
MSYTYATLKQAIQDWTENDETTFVNNINFFIRNAEERILKNADLDYFRKNVSGTMDADNKYLSMPTDYLASYSLQFTDSNGDQQFLLQKDVNFIQTFNPDSSDTGTPRYYAAFDYENFILGPTPDNDYATELHYYYRPASIVDANTTWLGTNAPNAMLYGSLLEAYTFMKGETDIIQLYMARFTESMQRMKNYAEGVENTDAYREGLVRIRKT